VGGSDSRSGLFLRRSLGGGPVGVELGEKLGGLLFKFPDAGPATEDHGAVRLAGLFFEALGLDPTELWPCTSHLAVAQLRPTFHRFDATGHLRADS
jgi:hypothetical protein